MALTIKSTRTNMLSVGFTRTAFISLPPRQILYHVCAQKIVTKRHLARSLLMSVSVNVYRVSFSMGTLMLSPVLATLGFHKSNVQYSTPVERSAISLMFLTRQALLLPQCSPLERTYDRYLVSRKTDICDAFCFRILSFHSFRSSHSLETCCAIPFVKAPKHAGHITTERVILRLPG